MVFYQFGADNYNDNRWDTMAVGNDEGTVSFKMGGKTYSGQFECPTSEQTGYVGSDTMQRMEVPGNGMWFVFTDAVKLSHKQGPDAEIYNQLGLCELAKKDYQKALEAFQAGKALP